MNHQERHISLLNAPNTINLLLLNFWMSQHEGSKGKGITQLHSAVSLPPAAGFGLIKAKCQQLPHAGRWGCVMRVVRGEP